MSMFCGKGGGGCLMIIIVVAFIILSYSTDSCLPIKWLAVVREWNSTAPCPRNKDERYRFGLAGYQAKICREKSEYMPFVVEAAINTIKECQEAFRDRRWNCSSILYAPKFLPDLRRGTQEQAYVHALAAASLIYSIARACSKNGLASCPCGRKPTESATNYKWDGCSDNLDHGYAFSVDWINAPSKGHHRKRQNDAVFSKNHHLLPLKQKINLHNSEVGRKIIAQNLEQKCRCHGVSMSCSLKSCYKILKPIKNISLILQAKYSLAKEVKEIRINNGLMHRKSDHINHHHINNYRYNNQHQQQQNNRIVEKFEHVAYSKILDDDLVYSKKSPDYCSPNLRLGSLGTVGRFCNASAGGSINCNSMCCGRGYRISEKTQKYQCHCQFVYCCSVECKICERSVEICK